jgi:hypothetical protein
MSGGSTQADVEWLRQLLIEKVDHQIEWREGKASEYPDDARNQQGADSLRRLEENLQALPPDHAMWFRLWNAYSGPNAPDDLSELTEIENERLRVYGFQEAENGDAIKFLEEYIEELEARHLDVHTPHGGMQ